MKKVLTTILIATCTLSFSACELFYSEQLAPTLEITETEIFGLEYYNYGTNEIFYVDTDKEFLFFKELFETAEPTRKTSLNDSPNVEEYYVITLSDGERFYLYERERFFGLFSEWYLEVPYVGIYKAPHRYAKEIAEFFLNN